MDPLTEDRIAATANLCQRFGVSRLDVFGSAATGNFDPQSSDIDFVVEFQGLQLPDIADRYFGLKEALEVLFGRPVDMVMAGAMRNSYFIESVSRSRRPVYVAPVATTA